MKESIFDGPVGKMIVDSLSEEDLRKLLIETWQTAGQVEILNSLEKVKEACISSIKAINLKLGIENEQF